MIFSYVQWIATFIAYGLYSHRYHGHYLWSCLRNKLCRIDLTARLAPREFALADQEFHRMKQHFSPHPFNFACETINLCNWIGVDVRTSNFLPIFPLLFIYLFVAFNAHVVIRYELVWLMYCPYDRALIAGVFPSHLFNVFASPLLFNLWISLSLLKIKYFK